MIRIKRITIIHTKRPDKADVNSEIKWLCSSLGLFNQRDKDSSCYRLFVELLKSSRKDEQLSSDAIAYRLNLTRGTVVHHLNKLIESGMVVSSKDRYSLRVDKLKRLIDELEKDTDDAFEEMKKIADKIDQELGL